MIREIISGLIVLPQCVWGQRDIIAPDPQRCAIAVPPGYHAGGNDRIHDLFGGA